MSSDRNLLIIEDDPGLRSQMRWCFEALDAHVAGDREEALKILGEENIGVVTLDLGLPPDPGGTSEGEALLKHIRAEWPTIKVIVITGRDEIEHAVNAVANGAYDFYQKPIESTTLSFAVERAFALAELEDAHRALSSKQTLANMPLPGLIAGSPEMLELCGMVKRIASRDITVLINGETGTGKEIVANNLHRLSTRNEGPLVTINCAAIPENLLESELFGHEKGSFTGAHARKIGKIEAANGGTLFLDEVGDMPLPLQAKILRFLQERTFERVGSTTSLSADVRVISATHRKLGEMIGDGSFREDLFYRLSEIELEVPPLRDRGTDVILIAERILNDNAQERPLKFSGDALHALETASWPGNVRELENRVRRAAILAEGDSVTAMDLQLAQSSEAPVELRTLRDVRTEADKRAIEITLRHTGFNISEAARVLEVSRPTLYSLIEKHEIQVNLSGE